MSDWAATRRTDCLGQRVELRVAGPLHRGAVRTIDVRWLERDDELTETEVELLQAALRKLAHSWATSLGVVLQGVES